MIFRCKFQSSINRVRVPKGPGNAHEKSAQVQGSSSPQTTTAQDKGDSTPQTEAKGEGGGGGDDVGYGDEDDELDGDDGQEETDTKKKKKTRRLSSGSNKEAHGLMKMLMPFWMGDASGPVMADSAARADRNKLSSACIRLYRIPGLVERAQAIEHGTDKEYDVRLRDIANFAERVEIS